MLISSMHAVEFPTCERFFVFATAIHKMRFFPNSKLQTHPDNLILPPLGCSGNSPEDPFGIFISCLFHLEQSSN